MATCVIANYFYQTCSLFIVIISSESDEEAISVKRKYTFQFPLLHL